MFFKKTKNNNMKHFSVVLLLIFGLSIVGYSQARVETKK